MARQPQNAYSQGSQFFIVYEDTTLPPTRRAATRSSAASRADSTSSQAGVTDAGTADGGTDGAPAVPVTITGFTIE